MEQMQPNAPEMSRRDFLAFTKDAAIAATLGYLGFGRISKVEASVQNKNAAIELPSIFQKPLENALGRMNGSKRAEFEGMLSNMGMEANRLANELLSTVEPGKREAVARMLQGHPDNMLKEAERLSFTPKQMELLGKVHQATESLWAAAYLVATLPYISYVEWENNSWDAKEVPHEPDLLLKVNSGYTEYRAVDYATAALVEKRARQAISLRHAQAGDEGAVMGFEWAADAPLETYLMANVRIQNSDAPRFLGISYEGAEPLHPIMKEAVEAAAALGISSPVTLSDVLRNRSLFEREWECLLGKRLFPISFDTFWGAVRGYEDRYRKADGEGEKTGAIKELVFFLDVTFLNAIAGVKFFNGGAPVGPIDAHPLETLALGMGRCELLDELHLSIAKEMGLMGTLTFLPFWGKGNGNHSISGIVLPFAREGNKTADPWRIGDYKMLTINGIDTAWYNWANFPQQADGNDTFAGLKAATGRQDADRIALSEPASIYGLIEQEAGRNGEEGPDRVFGQFGEKSSNMRAAPLYYAEGISLPDLNEYVSRQDGFEPLLSSMRRPGEHYLTFSRQNLTGLYAAHPVEVEIGGLEDGEWARLCVFNGLNTEDPRAVGWEGAMLKAASNGAVRETVSGGASFSDGDISPASWDNSEGLLYFAFKVRGESGREVSSPIGALIMLPDGRKIELGEGKEEIASVELGEQLKGAMGEFAKGVPESLRAGVSFKLVHPSDMAHPFGNLETSKSVPVSAALEKDGSVAGGSASGAFSDAIYLLVATYKDGEGKEKTSVALPRPVVIVSDEHGARACVY